MTAVSPRIVSEWYRCATVAPHPLLRRQIVEVDGGFQLTTFELAEKCPANLYGYDGGWFSPSVTYPTLAIAEQRMLDNGWTREPPQAGTKPIPRRRSGPGGACKNPVRTLRVSDADWESFGKDCGLEGASRNEVLNRLIGQYLRRSATNP